MESTGVARIALGLKSKVDAWMCIQVFGPASMHFSRLRMEHGWSDTKNIFPVLSHPRSIQIFGPPPEPVYPKPQLPLAVSARSHRCDRDAPIERSVAQMRAELWPVTCFCQIVHPEPPGSIHRFSKGLDGHPDVHTNDGFLFCLHAAFMAAAQSMRNA